MPELPIRGGRNPVIVTADGATTVGVRIRIAPCAPLLRRPR
ncbi:hypothetical protein [Nonomuraea sp. NEAU-A123]|nr:hypothetical protein [Nonomuraea sp. NEAU-A123]